MVQKTNIHISTNVEYEMELSKAFGSVFMKFRKAEGLTQEDFGVISSRTYVSHLERGLSSVTLDKLDELSTVLNVHPVSIVVQTYLAHDPSTSTIEIISKVMEDLKKIDSL